jgi:hypothetical protein
VTRRPGVAPVGILLGAGLGLVLTACADSSGRTSPPTTPRPSTTSTTRAALPLAPLTGLPARSRASAARPSLGVKIENTPEARPQSGLDRADIVFEEVVEGGITRFWAFFQSEAPATVGPIRSVRPMDPNIILPFGGIVAFSGGTAENVAAVRATGLLTIDEGNAGDAFFREPTRAAPHNLYGRTASLWARGAGLAPPSPMFRYRVDDSPVGGEPVASVRVGLQGGYDVTYAWDARRHDWARYTNGTQPFMAAGKSPVQVAPANVVVQLVAYGRGADGDVMGSGEALVFTGGHLVRGRWAKAFPPAPTQLLDAFGAPIALAPGSTWVELVPIGTSVDLDVGEVGLGDINLG